MSIVTSIKSSATNVGLVLVIVALYVVLRKMENKDTFGFGKLILS